MSSNERLGVSISGTRELYSKIDSLTGKELKKAILSSLRSSASILRRGVRGYDPADDRGGG